METFIIHCFKQKAYKQSIKEPCIWYKHQNTKLTLIGAYVDDLIITGDDESEISKLSITLSKNFKMKNLGELHEFLGIEVLKTSTGILLSQRKNCKEIVKRFGQDQCKPTWIPMTTVYDHAHDPQSDGSDEQKSRQFADKYPTREAIGCLMYLANATRPDIAHAVNCVSRYVTSPSKALWIAIQKILKYINTTQNHGLHFSRGPVTIQGYADSDFAGDKNDRKSTTGWIFKLGNNTISWRSAKQKAVTLSTTEAEYMAASDAAKRLSGSKTFSQN